MVRGVNTNPGADPVDLIGMRLRLDGEQHTTLRHRRLQSPLAVLIELIGDRIEPATASELFERLVSRQAQQMGAVIAGFEEGIETASSLVALNRQTAEIHLRIARINRFSALGAAEIVRLTRPDCAKGQSPPTQEVRNNTLLLSQRMSQRSAVQQ